MRNIKALIICFLLCGDLFGQTYTGTSTDKLKSYSCALKVKPDSSVVFIYHTPGNETFAQYTGSIKQLNDSLYRVCASMAYGKFDVMRLYVIDPNTNNHYEGDYFKMDTSFLKLFSPITIIYANGQVKRYKASVPFLLDETLFNKKDSFRYYTISTNATNEITGKKVSFRVQVESSPTFERGGTIQFDLLKKGTRLFSVGTPLEQTGHFKLIKNSN